VPLKLTLGPLSIIRKVEVRDAPIESLVAKAERKVLLIVLKRETTRIWGDGSVKMA
jgi:hypothetical protein